MKKILIFTLAIVSSFALNAQENNEIIDTIIKKNEVKLNALFLVLGAFDVTYERLLNEESAVGINVVIPYDEEVLLDLNYFISPYYRLYFGKKYASGFFLEGFGLLSSINREVFSSFQGIDPIIDARITEETTVNFALGIGIGGKWVTNNGFVGELNLGVGRNIINDKDFDEDFVGKVAITVGYRF